MGKRFTAYDLPLALFLASAVAGIFPAYDRSLSMPTLAVLLAGGLLYAALSRLANTRARWDAAALVLSVLVALISAYYVAQLGHMGFAEKIAPIARAADLIARLTPNLAFWKPIGNTIGTFLEGTICILVGLAWVERRPFRRSLLVGGLGVAALALLFSASRGAWTAVFGAGLLWAALYWKPARWLAVGICTALAGTALYSQVSGNLSAINDIPLVGWVLGPLFIRPDRLEVYHYSLALIRDVPFTGIGLGGQFGMVYSRYELLFHVPFLHYAHNLFLEIWLEQGLPGICAWIWLITSVFTTARRWRGGGEPGMRIRFESSWVGLAAVLIHSLTDARQAQAHLTWLPFFILLGLNAALVLQSSAQPRERWLGWLPAGAGAACLLLALVIVQPLPAAFRNNRAALLQHRADLASRLSEPQRTALLEQAAWLFQQTLADDPDNRTANQRMGFIALSNEDFDRAAQYLLAAYNADTRHPGTRRALGLAYTFSGKLEEALPLLSGQRNIVDELNEWGKYLSTTDQPQAGLNAYRMSINLRPDQPEVQEKIRQILSGND